MRARKTSAVSFIKENYGIKVGATTLLPTEQYHTDPIEYIYINIYKMHTYSVAVNDGCTETTTPCCLLHTSRTAI